MFNWMGETARGVLFAIVVVVCIIGGFIGLGFGLHYLVGDLASDIYIGIWCFILLISIVVL